MKEASCGDEKMVAYCNEVWKLEEKFNSLELHHILRRDNLAADFLAKLTSSREHDPLGVFVNDPYKPSTSLPRRPTFHWA